MAPAHARDPAQLRVAVRQRYAALARQLAGDGACTSPSQGDLTTTGLYPAAAIAASLGCGHPTALAALAAGEIVLDLGSGGGLDVLLAAQQVGPTGFVYGLDMTGEMLALAERHRQAQGVTNARFLQGDIEAIPLQDASVDVVISNCVINLTVDKAQVLREAFRVLRPGGRLAVADVVAREPLPAALRADEEAWTRCVAGALEEEEYRQLLAAAGFTDIAITFTHSYPAAEAAACCTPARAPACAAAQPSAGPTAQLASAFVSARKPA
ncbi:MAG TPA: arsenite methyltransferase [Chloroflexota bacterium]|nr:arsenite methyltransferase [Chloroflexota bacterium]